MTDAEKLEALKCKGVANGFDDYRYFVVGEKCKKLNDYEVWNHYSWRALLFNHDFARALFGTYPTYVHTGYNRYAQSTTLVASNLDPRIPAYEAIEDKDFATGAISYEAWQYHTMQAVISDDPIGYMYGAVFDA